MIPIYLFNTKRLTFISCVVIVLVHRLFSYEQTKTTRLLPRRKLWTKKGYCDICFEISDMGYVLSCGHKNFCYDCLSNLINDKCPMCRATIVSIKYC